MIKWKADLWDRDTVKGLLDILKWKDQFEKTMDKSGFVCDEILDESRNFKSWEVWMEAYEEQI